MIDKSICNISHDDCTGCKLCSEVCSKAAISFDYERGFWYPIVNANKCINCGLCAKKCPGLNIPTQTEEKPVACYGAKTRLETIREHSTSGGFFNELATNWINNGGYCIAAVYDEECRIIHACSDKLDTVEYFRQSKYAQSDIQGMYKEARRLLVSGEKVLFCGTPCQVEALLSYLGKLYENLLTMDFICLGICSPVAFRKYLDTLEKKYGAKVVRVWFKNKTYGWRGIATRVDFKNGKKYIETGADDLFMRAFVTDGLIIRPCCEFCKFRKIPHASDFTVADFWGIENVNPQIDDNKGLSAVFVNTEKGKSVFDKISDNLVFFETTVGDICKGNYSTMKPMNPSPKRDEFFDYLGGHTFKAAMGKYSSYRGMLKLCLKYRRLKRNIRSFLKAVVHG